MAGPRFFGLLALAVLALCAAYAALVLRSATWEQARALDTLYPFYGWHIRPFTAVEFARAGQQAALTAGGLALGLLGALRSGPNRAAATGWLRELQAAGSDWARTAPALPARQRWQAGAGLAALTVLRAGLSPTAVLPALDDLPSYELFASKGLLAAAAFYPVPNNHVLSNTLSGLFFGVHPGFWWTMRLPVLLVATAATGLLLVGLLRQGIGFRPAALAVVLFSLAPLSLYHAAVGRGYWLLTACAAAVFFSTLALLHRPARPRAAWTALVLAGILGTYTVPTFALVLASAFGCLGLGVVRYRAWAAGGRLVGAGALIGAGSGLLYFPLLFVSGPAALFDNVYVRPRYWSEIRTYLVGYVWKTEGALAGAEAWGGALTLMVLVISGAWFCWPTLGRLPAAAVWHRLVPTTLGFVLIPYAVLVAERVFAPARALQYKAVFGCVLMAGLAEGGLRRVPARRRAWASRGLGGVVVAWGAWQAHSLWQGTRETRRENAALHAAFAWLDERPRQAVLIPESTHNLFFRTYWHSERPRERWRIDAVPRRGVWYGYVLAYPNARGSFRPRFAYPPAFRNEQVEIYAVLAPPPGTVPAWPGYWHFGTP